MDVGWRTEKKQARQDSFLASLPCDAQTERGALNRMRPGKSFLLAANASTLNSVRSMANSLASDTKIRNPCPLPVGGKEGLSSLCWPFFCCFLCSFSWNEASPGPTRQHAPLTTYCRIALCR